MVKVPFFNPNGNGNASITTILAKEEIAVMGNCRRYG